MEPPITAVVRRVIVILRQEILESLGWRSGAPIGSEIPNSSLRRCFATLVKELHPDRKDSGNPLFQVMFVLKTGAILRDTAIKLQICIYGKRVRHFHFKDYHPGVGKQVAEKRLGLLSSCETRCFL
jgi:hypothetical protein